MTPPPATQPFKCINLVLVHSASEMLHIRILNRMTLRLLSAVVPLAGPLTILSCMTLIEFPA
jgi:hypothetical protein